MIDDDVTLIDGRITGPFATLVQRINSPEPVNGHSLTAVRFVSRETFWFGALLAEQTRDVSRETYWQLADLGAGSECFT